MIDPITGLETHDNIIRYLNYANVADPFVRRTFIQLRGKLNRQQYAADIGLRRYFGADKTDIYGNEPLPTRTVVPDIDTVISDIDVIKVEPPQETEPELKLCNDFLVGCDPEFVVINPPRVVNLGNYFGATGEIGYDHGGRVGELRPEPSKNTRTLIKRMVKIINEHVRGNEIRAWDWKAGAIVKHGSGTECLGGHVHVDIPFEGTSAEVAVPSMDKVTEWLEKLDIVPTVQCEERRAGNTVGYGQFGDIREHKGHLEYRTLPSWLYDPKVAYLCLTAIKLATRYPKDTYRALVGGKPTLSRFVDYIAKYRQVDGNAAEVADMVKNSVGLSTDMDFKSKWKSIDF